MILLAGCSEDITSALQGNDTKTISFNIVQPAWTGGTRAFTGTDVSSIDATKLQLLCFDSEGGFTGVGTIVSTSSATIQKNTKHIHFLYNCETTYSTKSYAIGTNEATVLSPNSLTTNNKMACWAYIDMANFTNGSTIYLKRNVAKVSVASGDNSKATATLYAVVNDMDKGSIAPFDYKNTSSPFSSSNYDLETGLPSFLTIPLDASRNTTAKALADNSSEAYLFETYQNTSNTEDSIAVIVKMTYASGTTRYHLMRLMDSNKKLFDIQRNHHYKITMNADIPEKFGYSSLEDALAEGAVPTNSYATIEEKIDWEDYIKTPSLVLLNESGNKISSISAYPAIDYNTLDVSSTGSVTKKFYFWYKNATEEVSSLTESDFSASTTIIGATATVERFDGTNKYGVVSLSIPNSSISSSSDYTVTISRTNNSNISGTLNVEILSWGDAFTDGKITYYVKSSDNSIVITGFSVTPPNSITSGTNLRVASQNLLPTSSSSFNNAYIDATPINGLNYWYNKSTWSSTGISDMSSYFAFRRTTDATSPTDKKTTPPVYVMADGIKPCPVTWYKEDEPTEPDYIYWYYNGTSTPGLYSDTNGTAIEKSYLSVTVGDGTEQKEQSGFTVNETEYKYTAKLNSTDHAITVSSTKDVTMTVYFNENNVVTINSTGYTTSTEPKVQSGANYYYFTLELSANTNYKIERTNSKNIYVGLITFTTK